MRWRPTTSGDVEDRRGMGGPAGALVGGGGLVGLVIYILTSVLGGGGGGFQLPSGVDQFPVAQQAREDRMNRAPDTALQFVSFVLDDLQQFWARQFATAGEPYRNAKLVLYDDRVSSGCGSASSAVGPFYCPADEKVYVDLTFFEQLSRELGAPGDFAQAYVIAHEIAHHVQHLVGTSDRVREAQRKDPDQANELSVRLELQADCLAGVWGHSTYQRGILESGDLEEGLTAASAIGDDTLQQRGGGEVKPETFTHGTSEQRRDWFVRGFESGRPGVCDTFSG